jgi:hypothetical protein
MNDQRKRFNQKYWAALLHHMKATLTPYSDNVQVFKSWPIAAARIAAKFNRKLKWIQVDLTLDGPDAKRRFAELEKSKEAIKKKIEAISVAKRGEWSWSSREGRGEESHIILRLQGIDPNNEKDWTEQHLWLAENLVAFREAFEPFIHRLL